MAEEKAAYEAELRKEEAYLARVQSKARQSSVKTSPAIVKSSPSTPAPVNNGPAAPRAQLQRMETEHAPAVDLPPPQQFSTPSSQSPEPKRANLQRMETEHVPPVSLPPPSPKVNAAAPKSPTTTKVTYVGLASPKTVANINNNNADSPEPKRAALNRMETEHVPAVDLPPPTPPQSKKAETKPAPSPSAKPKEPVSVGLVSGAPITGKKAFCTNCGAASNGDAFCATCGEPVNVKPAAATASSVSPKAAPVKAESKKVETPTKSAPNVAAKPADKKVETPVKPTEKPPTPAPKPAPATPTKAADTKPATPVKSEKPSDAKPAKTEAKSDAKSSKESKKESKEKDSKEKDSLTVKIKSYTVDKDEAKVNGEVTYVIDAHNGSKKSSVNKKIVRFKELQGKLKSDNARGLFPPGSGSYPLADISDKTMKPRIEALQKFLDACVASQQDRDLLLSWVGF